ncbi:Endonuclease/exonuclease/phosphatase, partial [Schizophyllum commune Loenen D]
LLAQCLVRRKLFPTSDCLKAAQREQMWYNELLCQNADIMCLQETDRLDKLVPLLEKAGYETHYRAGVRKLHGCMIAYKKDRFSLMDERQVFYDNQVVNESEDLSEDARIGKSFRTNNTAPIVALRDKDGDDGVIVATTHLFWHPRQSAILVREVLRLRSDLGKDWPCIISGDFNFQPDDPAYSLLVGDTVLPAQEEALVASMVVHRTVDPSVPADPPKVDDDEGEGAAATAPDRIPIKSARPAKPDGSDGLLSPDALRAFYGKSGTPLKSAYDTGLASYKATPNGASMRTYGDRVTLEGRRGAHEPEWTSYAHFWHLVLDYIFIVDPSNRTSQITGLLSTPTTADLEPGIPRLGKCSSDHVSLCAEIAWPAAAPATQ